ncbi:MAG: tyrosine-type recombinase/integrase [Dehalococcoidia bacterium]
MAERKRRAAGEGAVYQRKSDGKWVGAYYLGWREGRQVRKYVYGATQREVLGKLADVRKRAEKGLDVTNDRMTVEHHLSAWLASIEGSVRPNTFKRYQDVVRVHLIPSLGKHRLVQLTPQHVEAMLRAKQAEQRPRRALRKGRTRPLTPRTCQEIRTVLGTALRKAQRWGLIDRNAASLAEGPRVPHQEIQPLIIDDAREFLSTVRGNRLHALYTVAITCGLRQGEILGLRWEDIDLENGVLHVRRALQRVDGDSRLVETKTERSRRSVSLPALTVTALREHRVRQIEDRLAAGRKWAERWGLVFCDERGQPLHGPTVTREFQGLLAAAGLPRQRFHDLRHTAATFLLAAGVDLKVVSEILGHSTLAMTADVYSHVVGELKRDAADRMGAIFAVRPEAKTS